LVSLVYLVYKHRGPGIETKKTKKTKETKETQLEGLVVDAELLKILACPLDEAPVKLEGDRIMCTKCGRRYPVRDGIPVMLVDEAEMPKK